MPRPGRRLRRLGQSVFVGCLALGCGAPASTVVPAQGASQVGAPLERPGPLEPLVHDVAALVAGQRSSRVLTFGVDSPVEALSAPVVGILLRIEVVVAGEVYRIGSLTGEAGGTGVFERVRLDVSPSTVEVAQGALADALTAHAAQALLEPQRASTAERLHHLGLGALARSGHERARPGELEAVALHSLAVITRGQGRLLLLELGVEPDGRVTGIESAPISGAASAPGRPR